MHPMGSNDGQHEIVINWAGEVDVHVEMVPIAALTRVTRRLGPAEIIAALEAETIEDSKP